MVFVASMLHQLRLLFSRVASEHEYGTCAPDVAANNFLARLLGPRVIFSVGWRGHEKFPHTPTVAINVYVSTVAMNVSLTRLWWPRLFFWRAYSSHRYISRAPAVTTGNFLPRTFG